MSISGMREVPSLRELLLRRGIQPSQGFADYQDYIEQRQQEGCRPRLLRLPGLFAGDIHLALGRTTSVKCFWRQSDKRRV